MDSFIKDYPECFICDKSLKEPYIRCNECCPQLDVCCQCFSQGCESGQHSNDHSYEIISNSISVLEESWSAQEELALLDALGDWGIGNWAEVSKQVQTKTKEECESHYNRYYIQEGASLGLPDLRPKMDPRNKSRLTRHIPFKVSEDPPRPPMDSFRSVELAGYMPCRGDFLITTCYSFEFYFFVSPKHLRRCINIDVPETKNPIHKRVTHGLKWENITPKLKRSIAWEYDDFAEFDIKDISFDSSDSQLLQELKLAAVRVFLTRLRQRWYRKKIVRRYGLINIRKWQMLERRQTKSERDLREGMRPFARLQSPEEHEKLIQGIQMENYLKKEIRSLQEYRMAGIRTKRGAVIFDKLKKKQEEEQGKRKMVDDILMHIRDQKACQIWLQRQALLESGKSLAPIPLPSLGRKQAARLDLTGTPGLEQLSPDERDLCSTLRLLPLDYLSYKKTVIKENEKYGELRLAQARALIRIDVNKTRKMYNFFLDQGWISKPED